MVKIDRSDEMSIWLRCQQIGLEQLLKAFRSALKGEVIRLDATIAMSTLTLRRRSRTIEAPLRLQIGSETQLEKQEHGVTWLISREDLESGVERLERSIVDGFFSPAELMRVQVTKNRRLDYLYCEIV